MAIVPLPDSILKRIVADMAAGDELEISVADAQVLKISVPTGKRWDVIVKVTIEEYDA